MAAGGTYFGSRLRRPPSTRSVGATTASGGRLSKGARPTPQYKEREARNVNDDRIRAEVLAALGAAVGPQGTDPGKLAAGGATPLRLPSVPVEPVAGNPYKGLEAAIGRFGQASAKRSKGDVAAARKALKGRADPGADITGSFNAQAAGMAGELAATVSTLRNQARADFATAELERKGAIAKNKFEARSSQIKNDATLMEQMGGQAISLSMIEQAVSEGIDPAQYANNPTGLAVALGRARYARKGEMGLPPTAWAQAAQYGLRPPPTYGSQQNFYWALGQAKGGQYGGGTDALAILEALQMSGYLDGVNS